MTTDQIPLSRREARDPAHDAPPEGPSPADAEAAAAKRAKAETIGRYVAMFIMPFLMVGMMITSYLGTMHSPTPNGMPVVVAGASSAEVDAFASALVDEDEEAVDVGDAGTALEARRMVYEREASIAVWIEDGTATVYTATAAGASQATTATALVAPVALAEGLALAAEDVAPLPENDLTGMGAMFLTTALVMAGYLPFSMLRSNSPELLRFRRIVPIVAGWSALVAGLVWLVTGPILDVVSLDHSWALMAVAWLGVFAIGCVQVFLTRLFGSMGVIVGLALLMVLGMPASNMAMSVYTMPAFFQWAHGFLPMPAIGESMRSLLYFDGEGITSHLLVLAAGAVLGLLATKVFDAIERRRHPGGRELDVVIPSLHGGRRPKSRFWRYTTLFFFPFAMVTMMISCMLGAMHAATPKDMPVAVVGATVEQAEQTIAGLEEELGDMFAFEARDASDEDEVAELVEERELVAAFVLPSAESPSFTLVANQAGNSSAYQVVDRVFSQIASAQETPYEVDDVSALPDRDRNGVVTMYVAMGWILGGFMIVVVGANAQPRSRPLKRMLPITAVYAVAMSAFVALIAGPITGAVEGHFAALWGAGIVAVFCIAMFAMVFERLLGMLAIIPVIGTLMFLGVPSSNGALSLYMTPDAFRTLHDLLPMPAAVETVRSILYFDGDVVAEHLQVIGLWGLVSLALVLLIDAVKPVRTAPDFGDLAPRSPAADDPDSGSGTASAAVDAGDDAPAEDARREELALVR